VVLWTFTDAQGNQSTQNQNIIIDPTISYGIVITRVWNDLNGDGIQNPTEDTANIENIMVHLLDDGSGTILQSLITDSSGRITFRDVPVGVNLRLEYDLPAFYSYTASSGKLTDFDNSDVNTSGGNFGMTDRFSFDIACDTITYIDAGLLTPGSIEARVWNDLNGDQSQNANEDNANIGGVTVQLLDADDKDALLSSAVTDNNGLAVFSAVPIARKLKLKFILPAEYEFTKKSGKIEDVDNSDAADKGKKSGETSTFELNTSNELVTYIDAGLRSVAALTSGDIRKISVRYNQGLIEDGKVNIYPNPATHYLNIISEESEIKEILLYNSLGELARKMVKVDKFINQLDISELQNGSYYLIVKTDQRYSHKSFIKI
jgi:hypothetical protein